MNSESGDLHKMSSKVEADRKKNIFDGDLEGACCACVNVKWKPNILGGGAYSDRWVCEECGGEFVRKSAMAQELGSRGGKASKRDITPEQRRKMEEGKRSKREKDSGREQ